MHMLGTFAEGPISTLQNATDPFSGYPGTVPVTTGERTVIPVAFPLIGIGAALGAFALQHRIGLIVGALVGGFGGMLYERWWGGRSPFTGDFIGWPDAIVLGAGVFALNQVGAFEFARETFVRPRQRTRKRRRRRR